MLYETLYVKNIVAFDKGSKHNPVLCFNENVVNCIMKNNTFCLRRSLV